MSPGPGASRTQQQRSDDTRRVILDATVESLIDLGFARTTTLEVQRRAGVSRGALLHHFPAKAELLVAAIEHLSVMRGRDLAAMAGRLPDGGARTDAVIDLLWESFSGPLFLVAIELRCAARTDAELRAPLQAAELALRDRIAAQARTLFGEAVASRPGFDCALDITLQLMIGAAMTSLLHRKPEALASLIGQWKRLFPTLLGQPNAGDDDDD